jgi:periplasmic mercuric ion binding protein
MKYLFSILIFAFTCLFSNDAQAQTDTTEIISVSGNCEMCKKKIETFAYSFKGVKKAEWSEETNLLTLVYDKQKTNVLAVQTKIAANGYDTQKVQATDKSFNKLPGCCQYTRKKY